MFLKDLILGRFSLAKTFWGVGVLGAIGLSGLAIILISSQVSMFFVHLTIFLRMLLSFMVLSGITFILRNKKITFWGVIAWFILLTQSLVLAGYGFVITVGLIQEITP